MGHLAREFPRCDVLDELEAAVVLRRRVNLGLRDHTTKKGLPVDVVTKDGEDFVHFLRQKPIPVSTIRWVVPEQ